MSTLTNLTNLGIKDQEIRNGEVVELDTLTLKEAKKEKWSEVTNADDSADVIAAYAGDLAKTLQENEDLENDKNELEQQMNNLSLENGNLTQALQTGKVVDQRIDEFAKVMDDMESQLNVLTQHKRKGEQELNELKVEIEQLRQERDTLRSDVSNLQADRDNLENVNNTLKADRDNLESVNHNLEEQANALQDQLSTLTVELEEQNEMFVQYDTAWENLEQDVNKVMKSLYERAREAGVKFEEN